jgi:hypothetical protein
MGKTQMTLTELANQVLEDADHIGHDVIKGRNECDLLKFANSAELLAKAVLVQQEAIKSVLWVDECRCSVEYTSRKMHEPNTYCGELFPLRDALAQANALMGEK